MYLIKTPEVPSDAEAQAGTTITGLIKYILSLVEKSKIVGIDEEESASSDLTNLAKDVETLKADMAKEQRKGTIKKSIPGAPAGILTVPLPIEVDTNNYDVDMVVVGANVAIPDFAWIVLAGSKTTTQFQVKLSIDLSSFTLDFSINLL